MAVEAEMHCEASDDAHWPDRRDPHRVTAYVSSGRRRREP
jgi:hypothetical protein